jgi:uncharacterized protein with NAD-binding domain and iron-sulfur cluster
MQTEVRRLAATPDGVTGVILADNTLIDARYCIAAVPPGTLREMLPREWAERHPVFRAPSGFEPNPYISSYLWFARKLTREPFWTRVWSPTNLNYDSYDLSNIRAGWADRPSVIASNIIHSGRADGLSDDAIIDATVRELAELVPQAARTPVVHAQVHRIPMAIPCPYPGTERKRPETRTPVRGLLLAGDWTRTGLPASMESAVRSGWLAAEQVLADEGRPQTLAVEVSETKGLAGMLRRLAARRLRGSDSAGAVRD